MNNRQHGVPFRAIYGSTIQCPATVANSRVAIPAIALPATCVRIRATGANAIRFRSGDVTVVALTLVDPAQDPGMVEVWGINATDTHIAVITDSGTGSLDITFGTGV